MTGGEGMECEGRQRRQAWALAALGEIAEMFEVCERLNFGV
jgi:hypothetical protein